MTFKYNLIARCAALSVLGLAAQSPALAQADFASVLPRAAYVANAAVSEIKIEVSRNLIPADGQSFVDLSLQLLDANGKRITTDAIVTLSASGGKLYADQANATLLKDLDGATPGMQVSVKNGQFKFKLQAPIEAQDVSVRASAGQAELAATVAFIPQLRDWVAAGVVEGIISLRKTRNESAITPVRINDGFEDKLRNFENDFNNGKGTAAARAAFFVKGTISGQYLLTASYDSDKETRARMLRDIRPDEIYPVYGDSSVKAYEAQSSQRLFVRVDNGKNYALFGDFNTGAGFTSVASGGMTASLKQRDLGNYNRSLTGLRGHYEFGSSSAAESKGAPTSVVNVFASKDSLRQRVDDIAANGTSGPFSTSRNDAIENSEKVEIILRDRNNPGRILASQVLVRNSDYTFEPFSGRILLKGPLPSTDAAGNPQSLRVTYEIDQGGESFWISGVDAQVRVNDMLDLGASFVSDRNPGQRDSLGTAIPLAAGAYQLKELSSANIGLNLGPRSRVVLELGEAKNATAAGEISGSAARMEATWVSEGQGLRLNASHSRADRDFYNPGASINLGRQESQLAVQSKVSDTVTARATLRNSKDTNTLPKAAQRDSLDVGVDVKLNDRTELTAGLRKSKDNGSGLYAPAAGVNNGAATGRLYEGSGFEGSGGLFGTSTDSDAMGQTPGYTTVQGPAIDTTTAHLGLRFKATSDISLGAELESSVGGTSAKRAQLTANWQLFEKTALNARLETQTGIGSFADRAQKSNAFVLGVSNSYQATENLSGQVFSEYRLRDGADSKSAQIATGLRNSIDFAVGWRATAGLERLSMLNNAAGSATALVGGLEFTGSEVWRASTRLELRDTDNTSTTGDNSSSALLHTLTLGRKLDANWTALASHYFANTDRADIAGKQTQQRIQLGAAYRPVDNNRFDGLVKLEMRDERNSELGNNVPAEQRDVWIASAQGNWHPVSNWWVSARVATKSVDETLDNGVRDKFSANLLNTRLTYDINSKWDASLMTSILRGQGSKQYGYGLELGYAVATNLWLSAGYNWAGFRDRDLTGAEYTAKGSYIRLRYKFDEKLWK